MQVASRRSGTRLRRRPTSARRPERAPALSPARLRTRAGRSRVRMRTKPCTSRPTRPALARTASTTASGTSPRIDGLIRIALGGRSTSTSAGTNASATAATVRMRSSTLSVGYSRRISVECRGLVHDHFDAHAAQQVGRLAVFRGEARHRAHADAGEACGMRGIAVAAAVDVARAGTRDDGVLGVGADGNEIESRCQECSSSIAQFDAPQAGRQQHGNERRADPEPDRPC